MLFSNVMSDTSVILCTIVAWICTRDATICLKSIMPKQIFTETQNLHNFEEKKNSTFSRIFFSSCLPWCIKRAAHRSIFTTHIKRNMNIFTFFFFCLFFPLASNSLEKYLAFFAVWQDFSWKSLAITRWKLWMENECFLLNFPSIQGVKIDLFWWTT